MIFPSDDDDYDDDDGAADGHFHHLLRTCALHRKGDAAFVDVAARHLAAVEVVVAKVLLYFRFHFRRRQLEKRQTHQCRRCR